MDFAVDAIFDFFVKIVDPKISCTWMLAQLPLASGGRW